MRDSGLSSSSCFAVILLTISIPLFLSSTSTGLTTSGKGSSTAANIGDHGDSSGGSDTGSGGGKELVAEWQILTRRNFSSQIRSHSHILLLVTVPWSGEARSLRRELSKFVLENQWEPDRLKLMVVYRNSDKIIADILGATEEITFFYYQHSSRFKYEGHMRAKSILSSISFLMSFQPEEAPFKFLKSEEELIRFLNSTDEAVLLFEFCGWSDGLLHKKDDQTDGQSLRGNVTTVDGPQIINRNDYQKGMEKEDLMCSVENGFDGIPWMRELNWNSDIVSSIDPKAEKNDNGTHCTLEEFHLFESFFSRFTKVAKDIFKPPEKLRFAIISERSLLPLLSIESANTWELFHWVSECPNCSRVLQEEDLKTVTKMHSSLVEELNSDQSYYLSAFPAERASIVLFIDSTSKFSKTREESKSALEIIRRFAHHNLLSSQLTRMQDARNSGGQHSRSLSKGISNRHGPIAKKNSAGHTIVKFKDNAAFMLINEGRKISLDLTAESGEGNSAFDILNQLLQPHHNVKDTRLSLLAKKIGFQLLSDDLEVQVVDPGHSSTKLDQRRSTSRDSLLGDSEISDSSSRTNENNIFPNEDYLEGNQLPAVEEGKQSESIIIGSVPQRNWEGALHSEIKINWLSLQSSQENPDFLVQSQQKFESTSTSENTKCTDVKDDDGSHTFYNKNFHYMKQDSSTAEIVIENDHAYSAEHKKSASFQDAGSTGLSSVGGDQQQGPNGGHKLMEIQFHRVGFKGSYFFSDGGYRMLQSLTGGSKIPSVVLIDPVLQQHYVLLDEEEFTFSSLANFVDKYLNGSLVPYKRSELDPASPREAPQPPFVNLDFHEADSIPRVTKNTFQELISDSSDCDNVNRIPVNDMNIAHSNNHSTRCISKRDVLVLFSNSWCGFCLRTELVVREVNRSLMTFTNMLKRDSTNKPFKFGQDKSQDELNEMPSIFYMDCTLNDCSPFLRPVSKGEFHRELYPALVLYSAEKNAVLYEGEISVNSVIQFLAAQGSNSQYLNRYKDILWTYQQYGRKDGSALHETSHTIIHEVIDAVSEKHESLVENTQAGEKGTHHFDLYTSDGSHHDGGRNENQVVVGSLLYATNKLLNAFPFTNSSILIVSIIENQLFQGLITNKHISWDVFEEMDEVFVPLTNAPLLYGGPLQVQNMPLVSLTRKAAQGYSLVSTGLYYGNPVTTSLAIESIKVGNESAADYWFFLGFSSWEWDQLFREIAEGSWNLSSIQAIPLDWPEI